MSNPNKNIFNHIFSFTWRLSVSGLLLWWLAQKIDLSKMWETARAADPAYLIGGLLAFIVVNIIVLYRWWIFIDALDVKASFYQVVRYLCFGLFGNLFLPSAIGGDIIKAVGITRGMDKKEGALASILLDRLSGFAGIAVLGIAAFLLGGTMVQDQAVLGAIAFMAIGSLLAALVLFHEGIYSFCCRIFSPFPKIKQSLMTMHYDIALVKDKPWHGLGAIGVSLITQTGLALMYWLTVVGFGADVHFGYFLIFSPIVCIVSTLPSIGGLGVREVGWVILLAKVGVPQNVAASMSLMAFLFMIVVGLSGGLFYVITLYFGRIQSYSPHTASVSGQS